MADRNPLPEYNAPEPVTTYLGSDLPTGDPLEVQDLYIGLHRPTRPSSTTYPGATAYGDRESSGWWQSVPSPQEQEELEAWERYAHIVNTYSEAGNLNITSKRRAARIGPDPLAIQGSTASTRSRTGPREVRAY